jgi:hypothetical protein
VTTKIHYRTRYVPGPVKVLKSGMIRMTIGKDVEETPTQYWTAKVKRERPCELKMKAPCEDCAVINGMYRRHADDLATLSEPLRSEALKRWECHLHTNCACAGAALVARGEQ